MVARRLAAILAADIAGCSALMWADEAGTLAALRHLKADILGPLVDAQGGRIAKSLGDGWLVEFPSAVDAVVCACRIQDRLAGHPTLRLRIGLHVGDVTHEDGDIFGDGVNVAARLEAIAEPGGIVLSDTVWSSLDGTMRPGFEDGGARSLKNIARPVHVWHRRGSGAVPAAGTTGVAESGIAAVVLPFGAAGDGRAAELAAGIAEDVTTELGRFRWLRVMAGSTGATPEACYAVGGTVSGTGALLRVTAHLAFLPDGRRLWSERWDRDATDPFAVQDELCAAIVTRIASEIDANEQRLVRARPIGALWAMELVHRATLVAYDMRPESLVEAADILARALARDPTEQRAHSLLAVICRQMAMSGAWPPRERAEAGLAAARRALALDLRSARAYSALGANHAVLGEKDRALEAADRAMTLNPRAGGATCASPMPTSSPRRRSLRTRSRRPRPSSRMPGRRGGSSRNRSGWPSS